MVKPLESLSLEDVGKIVKGTKNVIQRLETRKNTLIGDIAKKEKEKSEVSQAVMDLKATIKSKHDVADGQIRQREEEVAVKENEANRLKSEGLSFKRKYENALKETNNTQGELRLQIESGAKTEEEKQKIVRTLKELVKNIQETLVLL